MASDIGGKTINSQMRHNIKVVKNSVITIRSALEGHLKTNLPGKL